MTGMTQGFLRTSGENVCGYGCVEGPTLSTAVARRESRVPTISEPA
jgi:hypothetical protein